MIGQIFALTEPGGITNSVNKSETLTHHDTNEINL